MSRLTAQQGKRLCELVHLLRRDWDLPGIEHAVRTAATDSDAADVCVAAIRASQNLQATSPGIIPLAGAHWQQTAKAAERRPDMCDEHPDQRRARCQECAALGTPAPTGWRDRIPKAPRRDKRNPVGRARLTPDERAAAERAADQQQGDQS